MLTTPRFRRFIIVSLASLAPAATHAQDANPITQGQVVEGSLAAETAQSFTIELAADSFVMGMADQISVDVIVRIFGPDEKLLGRFDNPATGPERFQFETKVDGAHRIEIDPFESGEGDFTLTISRIEPVATEPGNRVDQLMTAFTGDNIPGGAIGVVRDGKLIFSRAYGMANLTYDIPYSIETTSNIGSTSKQFTAFAICLLEKEGKLSLDDDIRTHIPELPDLGHVVTLRNVLTHTSGYREYLNLLELTGRLLSEGDYVDRNEVVEMIKYQPELQSEPGTEWNYNNSGYALMTIVVEKVTSQPFDEWMKENVFAPLGMDQTRVRAHRFDIVPGSASGYVTVDGGVFRESTDFGGAMGASAIYTNVGDLTLWINNLHTGELGGKALVDEMTTKYVLTNGEATNYGLGLMIDELRGLRRVHHGGSDVAHRSMLVSFPTINAGIITHSNNATFPSGEIAAKVAIAFFGDEMEDPDADAAGENENADTGTDAGESDVDTAETFDTTTYDTATFDALAGRYALDEAPAFILTFFVEDGKIYTQATGQDKIEVLPTSETTFALTVVDANVEFHLKDDGTCDVITFNQGGPHTANRVEDEAWAPSDEQIVAYCGQYFSEELETFYTVVYEDDKLIVRHRRFEKTLAARDEDSFGGAFPIVDLMFTRNDAGNVTGLSVGNGRTRDVRFTKLGD